jgi:glutaminase
MTDISVSTGQLPPPEAVADAVAEAHRRHRDDRSGDTIKIYPALAAMPPDLFGLAVVGVSGRVHAAGDADHPFSLMSVSKPFVFALLSDAIGGETARAAIGVNATGLPFNALAAIEQGREGRTNPMVNAGAIAATSLVPGGDVEAKWRFIEAGITRFAGRPLERDDEVYHSASLTNTRNKAIGLLLATFGRLGCDPVDAVELYTRQCSLKVTARDLAAMGATLAGGGVQPLTGAAVVSPESARNALAVMTTAGLYETSGDWLFDVGLPGKSGISGGIVTVAPGKGALGSFAPRLDAAGNSVKGQHAARFLAARLGLDLFASRPGRGP